MGQRGPRHLTAITRHGQRCSCIYAVTPWRALRQVKKKEMKFKKNVLLLKSV